MPKWRSRKHGPRNSGRRNPAEVHGYPESFPFSAVVSMAKKTSHTVIDEVATPSQGELPSRFGFRSGEKGSHTSRTMMLAELRLLLDHCRPEATRSEYVSAICEDNCLGKRTAATRKASNQRLSELYALEPEVPLFRIMRRFWYADPSGQAILAMLLAMARDPLLRATAPSILKTQPGEELAKPQLVDAISRTVGSRLSESTLDKVVRNAASSWTQSGHLGGHRRKIRQKVDPTPITVAYALLLGYLAGIRGQALFESLWARVLDAPPNELTHLAVGARRLGLLDMTQSGGVVEVSLTRLLTQDERR